MQEFEDIANLFDEFLFRYNLLAMESIRHVEEDFDQKIADKLMKKTFSDNILLKLGSDGLIAQCQKQTGNKPHTEKLDALNANPKDVSGAGDSMLATTSLALISGANLWEASLLGNIAAFLQVGRLGNVPIKSQEIAEIIS